MSQPPTLHFLCGKMAAGKSTLARELAKRHDACLLEEDHFLATLYPGEVHDVADYVRCSRKIRQALADHIVALLASGRSVVLDFPANTPAQRHWFRQLFERAAVPHVLHHLDVPDEICKLQLQARSAALPAGAPFTTGAEFDAVTRHFQPPAAEERFNVLEHARAPATREAARP